MRYRWCCFKARFIGTFITDAETGEPIRFKFWRTTGMYSIPRRGEAFRVGRYTGTCVMMVPGFVVMRCD